MEKMYLCSLNSDKGNIFRVFKGECWDDARDEAERVCHNEFLVSVCEISNEQAKNLINELRKNLPELV